MHLATISINFPPVSPVLSLTVPTVSHLDFAKIVSLTQVSHLVTVLVYTALFFLQVVSYVPMLRTAINAKATIFWDLIIYATLALRTIPTV